MDEHDANGGIGAAKERVRRQYGAVGDAYVRSVGHATGNDLERMVALSAPQPTERLLDIATGGGHVARVFASHVREIVATDLTPEMLHHAAESFAKQELTTITTRLADAEALPFADQSFDLVTCRIAPHHFPRPDRFVHESARMLTSGGRFVLVDTTVSEGASGVFTNRIDWLRDHSHVRALTIAEWEQLIQNAGLDLQHRESFRKRHDFDDWTSRSGMPDADRDALNREMVNASEEIREDLRFEIADGRLRAWTDTKTLFVARKA